MLDIAYALVSGAAAIALYAYATRSGRRDAGAWKLIAVGLGAGTLGDLALTLDPQSGSDPSPATALYLAFYLFALLGLRRLGGEGRTGLPGIPAVLITALGLATLWSWLVFGPLVEDVEGPTGAVANTLAYPFLDLLLLVSLLVVLAAHQWQLSGSLVAILVGVGTIAVGNLLWAAEIASGSIVADNVIGACWALGAVILAGAARWPAPPPRLDSEPAGRLVPLAAVAAMSIALIVQVSDHFARVSGLTIGLATLTLLAAMTQLILLYRGNARLERQRRELHDLHAASAHAALDCIVTADAEGRVREWNRAAERTFGYSRDDAIGRRVADLIIPPAHVESHLNAYGRMVAGTDDATILGRRVQRIARRSDGSDLPVELAVTRVSDQPPMFTAFIRDITVTQKRNEERERLAAMVRSTEDAMFSSSLDGTVLAWNPAAESLYGYPADEAIGERLLARLVPGEFEGQAQEMLRRVRLGESVSFESIRRRKFGDLVEVALRYFPIRDEIGRITGCAVVARDITDRRRREAEERRNRERVAWRGQIEDALELDCLEFHAQPVWSLENRRIDHHELLIRMDMNDEIVSPGDFLPHAESSPPLMRRIDGWAIRRGIELARCGRVAINLSATSLSGQGIVQAIEDSLARHEVDPDNVIFEITETAAAENLDAARALVGALTQMGCRFALDDFGTGFNSFTYLKHLPVTELKIDIDFIRGLAANSADQRVVRSIVAVAENFGLATVAEGVEDEASLELLTEMGVDCAQGYLLGRPSPEWTRELDVTTSEA